MLILTWGSLGLGVAKAAELSIADVAKHNTAQDCYMEINGKVYDITSYFGSHPGGDSYLKAVVLMLRLHLYQRAVKEVIIHVMLMIY